MNGRPLQEAKAGAIAFLDGLGDRDAASLLFFNGLVGEIDEPQPLRTSRGALKLAIDGIITAVTRGLNAGIGEGLLIEREQFARLAPSHDLREGLAAWLERRRPQYLGR